MLPGQILFRRHGNHKRLLLWPAGIIISRGAKTFQVEILMNYFFVAVSIALIIGLYLFTQQDSPSGVLTPEAPLQIVPIAMPTSAPTTDTQPVDTSASPGPNPNPSASPTSSQSPSQAPTSSSAPPPDAAPAYMKPVDIPTVLVSTPPPVQPPPPPIDPKQDPAGAYVAPVQVVRPTAAEIQVAAANYVSVSNDQKKIDARAAWANLSLADKTSLGLPADMLAPTYNIADDPRYRYYANNSAMTGPYCKGTCDYDLACASPLFIQPMGNYCYGRLRTST